MLSRIDIRSIVTDHFATLHDTTGSFAWKALIGFFIIPLIVSIMLQYFGVKISNEVRNGLLTALTLLAGLMLNLLAIAYSMIKPNRSGDDAKVFTDLLRETCSNISYSVLVSIFSIILLIAMSSPLQPNDFSKPILITALNCSLQIILYFLLLNIVLTLAMILKRIHKLMMKEIGPAQP